MKQHKHLKPVLKWWLIFCVTVFGTLYAQMSIDLFSELNKADVTKLSFLIIGVFYTYMIALGISLSKFCKNIFNYYCARNIVKMQKHGWFLSQILLALGFLGTLIGIKYMMNISGLGSGSAEQATLLTLTSGMNTAMYTTIMALIAGIIIQCTLYVIENDINTISDEQDCKLED